MFWPGTSSTNFYKTTVNSNINSPKNKHSDHRLHGRYALDEPNSRRPEHGKGHIDFFLTAIGVHNKSEKISTVSNPGTGTLGLRNRLSQQGSNFGNWKSKTFNSEILKFDEKFQTNVVENYKLYRFTFLNSTSCNTGIFTNTISATTTSGIYKKAISLLLNSSSEPNINSGTSTVGEKPRNIQYEVNFVT